MTRRDTLRSLKANWPILSYYQRFESMVALALTLIIGGIILVALFRLIVAVIRGVVLGVLDPLEPVVFQAIFGEVLTLLIALEFNHTLQYVVTRQQSIIQTKVVLLIAILAIARKFIILDLHETSAEHLFALGVVTLVLGITYWLMRERDDRATTGTEAP